MIKKISQNTGPTYVFNVYFSFRLKQKSDLWCNITVSLR